MDLWPSVLWSSGSQPRSGRSSLPEAAACLVQLPREDRPSSGRFSEEHKERIKIKVCTYRQLEYDSTSSVMNVVHVLGTHTNITQTSHA